MKKEMSNTSGKRKASVPPAPVPVAQPYAPPVRDEAQYASFCGKYGQTFADAFFLQFELEHFIDAHECWGGFQSQHSRTQMRNGPRVFCVPVVERWDETTTVKATLSQIFRQIEESQEKFFSVERVSFADMMDNIAYHLEGRDERTKRQIRNSMRTDPKNMKAIYARVRALTGGGPTKEEEEDLGEVEETPTFAAERAALTKLLTTGASAEEKERTLSECLSFHRPDAGIEATWNDGYAFFVHGGKLLLGWYDPESFH